MRIPLSWLAEYVDLPADVTPAQIQEALVRIGFEEEGVHGGGITGHVVVGEVLDFMLEEQASGKTIRWCQVRVAADGQLAADGGEPVRGIVCGAANFFVGDKVVVTLPGAILPGSFLIAARKTYGHISDGMMASARELGLGDEHNGIIRLVELGLDEAPIGSDALELLGLVDSAIEINVTPDRGYALSIRGVAREYSHATGAVFRDPAAFVVPNVAEGGPELVRSDDNLIRGVVGCGVFVTRIIHGVVANRITPKWLAARLELAGIRPRTLLVDITNYVMLELGQPIHGYDLDTLTGRIVVRRARAGEQLVTLDGRDRLLDPEDLLITDDSGPIGLAGVMGGAKTELRMSTSRVLIEAANFDPVSIARTARRHKLPSEASRRFERGVDPQVAEVAATRVAQLMVELAGGRVVAGRFSGSSVVPRPLIELPTDYVAARIGVDYSESEICDSLTMIGAEVTKVTGGLSVVPPSWRPDLRGVAELSEEVARLQGFERIPALLPVAPPGRGLTRVQQLRRRSADALAAVGAVEVLTFPFVTAVENEVYGAVVASDSGMTAGVAEVPVAQLRLANAIDQSSGFMRRSLIPGLLAAAKRNRSRGLTDLWLFEQGLVFRPDSGREYGVSSVPSGTTRPLPAKMDELLGSVPPQPRYLSVLLTGNSVRKQAGQSALATGIVDALDAVRLVVRTVGGEVRFEQGTHPALHPGRAAAVTVGGITIGFAGELLPSLAVAADLNEVVAVAELDLDLLFQVVNPSVSANAVRIHSATTQDISLEVSWDIPAADVIVALAEGCGELLEEVVLIDDYRGENVAIGRKSLTFTLRFRALDRTLTAAEASVVKLAGVARAVELTGASLRV